MILKTGVKLINLKPQLIVAFMVADSIYQKHGKELVITSVDDSKHGATTLHGKGLAFDCRTSYFTHNEANFVYKEIKLALTDEFDVVLESDHIHIEFDPK